MNRGPVRRIEMEACPYILWYYLIFMTSVEHPLWSDYFCVFSLQFSHIKLANSCTNWVNIVNYSDAEISTYFRQQMTKILVFFIYAHMHTYTHTCTYTYWTKRGLKWTFELRQHRQMSVVQHDRSTTQTLCQNTVLLMARHWTTDSPSRINKYLFEHMCQFWPGSGDTHIFRFNFDVLAQGNGYNR